jgi:hypothetical protein
MMTQEYDAAKQNNTEMASLNDESTILKAYALCFSNQAGRRVLDDLRRMTKQRVLGPEASDALLRHVEGQRCLVQSIEHKILRAQEAPYSPTNNYKRGNKYE